MLYAGRASICSRVMTVSVRLTLPELDRRGGGRDDDGLAIDVLGGDGWHRQEPQAAGRKQR